MKYTYEPELISHMERIGRHIIVVEVVSSSSSDFDVTELHIHAVDEKTAAFFESSRQYRRIPTEHGAVLLPPYRLQYDEEIVFSLKKVLFFRFIRQTGIRL